jgi:transcription elongation factor GreB
MGRWRAPAPRSTALITREGYEALRTELDELWNRRRPEVVSALSAAAAEGDRSENAEYIYRKKQLGEIDRRVRYLTKRMESLKVVSEPPTNPQAVYFGAWIELEDGNGRLHRYRIVGPDEIDAKRGWISIDAPLSRALLGRRIDDSFQAELPLGKLEFWVMAVHYECPDWQD